MKLKKTIVKKNIGIWSANRRKKVEKQQVSFHLPFTGIQRQTTKFIVVVTQNMYIGRVIRRQNICEILHTNSKV